MKVLKNGRLDDAMTDDAALELINAHTRRPLTAEEVYTFKVAACDDQIDRDFERFPKETLELLAKLFVGKTVVFDHNWSASLQTARIYSADVEEMDGVNRLIARCYMLRDGSEKIVSAIDGGILREVSVACAVKDRRCSICGEDILHCAHIPGQDYDGKTCCGELLNPTDAFELSFVAVPAQPGAGVTKSLVEKAENAKNEPEKTPFARLFENFV